ncbi:MAG: FAD-dependent oxidoreductase [Ruminococcaceae bacterium]|nr:FAD-dependent oxidoreductase [Oscillospiraceae bacterium]
MRYVKEITKIRSCQVAVCGGGFAGFAAAYAAAREGLRVLLIERNGALGGVGTLGLVNHLLGARAFVGKECKTCVGGLFAQIEDTLLKRCAAIDYKSVDLSLPPHGWFKGLGIGLVFDNEEMKRLLEELLSEVGVEILYYTDVIDVIRHGEKAESLVIHNKSGFCEVRADYFVDATGDGDIYAMAGCPFEFGNEEGGLAAASLEMHVENVDHQALINYMKRTDDRRFRAIIGTLKEAGIWRFPYEIFISVMMTRPDVFMINTIRQVGINGTDAESLSRGVLEGRKESFALLEIMRNHFPGFSNAQIRSIAPSIGIRETRRLKAMHVLGVEDLIKGESFPDSIALSGYGWDMPDPKHPSYQPYHGVARRSPFTEIPYRSLLPLGVDNLIAVGRCIGAEREALGAIRVMAPCIAMGEAAGIAASLALRENCPYRHVDISVLRERLIRHGGIVSRNQITQ